MVKDIPLSSIEKSLLAAAWFRGGDPNAGGWFSNSNQVLTLSLFYTGDISFEDCAERFSRKRYVGKLYQSDGSLTVEIETRYQALLELLRQHPELIEGGGNLKTPADPTFTSCRLTAAGQSLACVLIPSFPRKPEFPNWHDKRTYEPGRALNELPPRDNP